MYKFKIRLLYNAEEHFCAKTVLLNFKFALQFAKIDMVGVRVVSNSLTFSDDIPVDTQLVTLLLLSNITEPSMGQNKNFLITIMTCKIHSI